MSPRFSDDKSPLTRMQLELNKLDQDQSVVDIFSDLTFFFFFDIGSIKLFVHSCDLVSLPAFIIDDERCTTI